MYKELDHDFSKELDTYILGYCPDSTSWFATKQRGFFFEYEKNFSSEEEAVAFFVKHSHIFLSLEEEMLGGQRPKSAEGKVFLEHPKSSIEVPAVRKKDEKERLLDCIVKFTGENDWNDFYTPDKVRSFFTTLCFVYNIDADTLECNQILAQLYEKAKLSNKMLDFDSFESYMLTFVV